MQVERRTAKVRRPKTDVLPLCHATNLVGYANDPAINKIGEGVPCLNMSLGGVINCSSPLRGPWARRWINHKVCDPWPVRTVTFPALERHRPLTGSKLAMLGDRNTGVSSLAKATAQWCRGRTRKPDLQIASPMPYTDSATTPPCDR